MASREFITRSALAAAILVGGVACASGPDTPTNINSVDQCDHDETNVEPTYVPGQAGYSPRTDPNVVANYQKSLGGDWGVGRIVCNLITDKNWRGAEKTRQVFTQGGLQLALKMPTAQK